MSNNIVTTYYNRNGEIVKTNRAKHPRTASTSAFDHLQMDHYDASVASVHDDNMGELHVILKRDLHGNIRTLFKRDAKTPTVIEILKRKK